MKELLGEFGLYNRQSKTFEAARVYKELDQKNYDDFKLLWKPILDDRRVLVKTAAEAADLNIQDCFWDWVGKAKAAKTQMAEETFAIECGGETQGLMLVSFGKFGRHNEQKGLDIAYVELLSTAPWNRHKTVASPRYKGVGRLLIAAAISLSIESGLNGRLGLHSLPQSATWYRDVAGFTDLGLDAPKKMHYFEITHAQAEKFLKIE